MDISPYRTTKEKLLSNGNRG